MKNPFFDMVKLGTVGFLGIGKSSLALLKLLSGTGVGVILRDRKKIDVTTLPTGLNVLKIYEEDEEFSNISEDFLIFSPSVRRDRPELLEATGHGCIFSSDFEIFSRINNKPTFLVTGSDGKTTTTTLVSKILGHDFPAIGNIGEPMTPHLTDSSRGYVFEASSFMLNYYAPKAKRAAITSLSPNHLDWHGTFSEYKNAKIKAIENADEAVISADSSPIFEHFRNGKKLFSVTSVELSETRLKSDFNAELFYTIKDGYIIENRRKILCLSDLKKKEKYNVKNYLTALALTYGWANQDSAIKAISEFSGLPHRCEKFANIRGVEFINSSIDTSPDRTMATIDEMKNPLIILLGGRDKGLSFDELSEKIIARGDRAIVYGESGEKIKRSLCMGHCIFKNTFRDAVDHAMNIAHKGDTVLLSPACASYDEFSSFEERGNLFKKLVLSRFC